MITILALIWLLEAMIFGICMARGAHLFDSLFYQFVFVIPVILMVLVLIFGKRKNEKPIQNAWLSSKGRTNRKPFFLLMLAIAAIFKAQELIPINNNLLLPYVIGDLTLLYILVLSGIKRSHDRGRTGWFFLIYFVPLFNLWPLVELTFFRGNVGPNQYGPNPLEG